ncbi:MAG: nickel pincer cofactor biosynthesis protein LarB [Candidatus Bathyarchaeum tardum]|nr:MAG: nickel pincer cofactor biosynthesis protein LarB [Candidatus Bathyarchaeum tardum]
MYTLREILEKVAQNQVSVAEAEKLLRILAIDEIENVANIDSHRELRKGVPEVILADGKDTEHLTEIVTKMLETRGRSIISRCNPQQIEAIRAVIPSDVLLQVFDDARMMVVQKKDFVVSATGGKVGIITAGTSDIAVAEEAKIICKSMGCEVISSYDIGVAGIHRLIAPMKNMIMEDIDVLVVVAGREGALPSVVAGIVDVPVIAVPTSNSYGLGEKGASTLMAMLQSCSLGLAVVNIDSGVAAGAVATLIANRAAKFRT